MGVEVIKPPKPITKKNYTDSIHIFLAGSIEMGKAENWQDKVEKYFLSVDLDNVNVTLFNPRRDSWNNDWEQSIEQPNFYQQVSWELNTLNRSDIIIMYFDPSTKSPISLLELGLYASSKKLFVCCSDGFWRRGNVEVVCEKYGIPFFNDLNKLLKAVKSKVKTIDKNEK